MKNQNPKWLRAAIVIVVLAMSTMGAFAQKVPTYQSYFAGLSNSDQQSINSLINGAQPTASVNANGISVFGNGNPTVLDVSAANFVNINFSDSRLADVRLIRIRINAVSDFSQVLDLSPASALNQLSCVYMLSTIPSTAAQFSNLLQNLPTNVSTCFNVSIPE